MLVKFLAYLLISQLIDSFIVVVGENLQLHIFISNEKFAIFPQNHIYSALQKAISMEDQKCGNVSLTQTSTPIGQQHSLLITSLTG